MTEERKQLTVGKLREFIKDLPDDMLVQTEGCDCTGESYGVQTFKSTFRDIPEFLLVLRDGDT